MALDLLSMLPINWSLFLLTSLLVCFRTFGPSLWLWALNKFYISSNKIDTLTNELKHVSFELKTLSQQDEFAAYTRKERQRNSLVEQLKNERNHLETSQKNLSNLIHLVLNIGTIFVLIVVTITRRQHNSLSLFDFPFFHFPLIIWIIALSTFVTTLSQIFFRYRIN